MTANVYMFSALIVFGLTVILAAVFSKKSVKYSKSKLKLDISLLQMRKLEDNVSSFLESNGMSPGATIWSIAEKLNIEEGEEIKRQEAQALLSEPDENGKMVVTFTRGLTQEERIFAFAHECAHLVNEDDAPVTRPHGRNKPLAEQLADYTAAALLMPIDSVYDILLKNNYSEANPRKRMKIVRQLCERYQVSDIIALRRIQEVYVLKNEL